MGEGEFESDIQPENQKKKSRNRKNHLYKMILQQMDFYFSDSNLTKDRFLSQLLTEHNFVEIDVFMQFNKIKKLNCTIEDIQKAIKKSELIELSEDGTKISRSKPVKVKENVEECTIYIENIKADSTHDSLSQIFSDFGKVVYVSIPKYKHNKATKGFAFIEFENQEQANNAVSYFESIGCKIPKDKNPDELVSIATYEGDQNDGHKMEEVPVSKKRKFSYSSDEENDARKTVRTEKTSVEIGQPSEDLAEKAGEIVGEQEKLNDDAEESKKKKKIRKDKRKNCIKELGMKVATKKEWKKLRNKYLDLQKKKMKEFKQHLYKQRFAKKTSIDQEMDEKITCKPLEFSPGVIIKLNLTEPCVEAKKLKSEIMSKSPQVQYVDIPLPAGSEQVFVRFSDKEAAKEFADSDYPGEKMVLDGDEEQNYWEKLTNDRKIKFQKSAKKMRGRDKLLKRAEKDDSGHVRFDE